MDVLESFGIPSSPADFNWDGIVDELNLQLMNDCMGAIADPNIVRIDTNYDSRVNLPDFGLFAVDYGYDPNNPDNNDPNCERSDFNGDHQVDIEDVAILSEYWLTLVFDEHRICTLCNLHTGADPNDPNAPGGAGVIDQRDMDAFMADWGKQGYTGCSVSFKDGQDVSLEPNSLSDEIAICADNLPPSTVWLFALVDNCPAGLIYLDDIKPPVFTVPTYELSNGYHTITVGGYTSEGGCWMEKIPVRFHNCLYFASIPTMYEPNEPYEIRGFFDGGSMQISTDPNYYVSSDSGYIQYSSLIAGDSPAATLQYQNGEDIQTKTVGLMAAVDMTKIDPNSYRALIVAPFEELNEDYDVTLTAIREVLKQKHISYVELIEHNANWDNIKRALTGPNLNYVYWIGHMNSEVGETRDKLTKKITEHGVFRTGFQCWDKGRLWGYNEGRIFSGVLGDTSNPIYGRLPDDWDKRGHSMVSLKLRQTHNIKEFWAIGCESGCPIRKKNGETIMENDMAWSVGVYDHIDNDSSGGHYSHVYIGNTKVTWSGGILPAFIDYPSAIAHIIQNHSNVEHDLEYALIHGPRGAEELKAIWGEDANRDGWAENTLQWWPASIDLWRVIFQ